MAAQIQLANTFNEFRTAYNDAANDISTLQAANTTLNTGVANIYANTAQIVDLDVGGGRVLVSRAPVSGTGALVDDDAGLTYNTTTNRLTVDGPVDANGAVRVTSLTANNLTSGRVAFAGASGLLSDDAELRYVTANNALLAANVTVDTEIKLSALTSGRVLIAGTGGVVSDDSGLTYNSSTDSLSASGNITATAWANAANMNVTTNLQVGANVNVTGTVNAASDLHVGGAADWIIDKEENQDIHLVTAVAESDGAHDIAIVNRSNSANAYAELIAINNAGNTETGWVSIGINATNYDQGAFAVTKGEDAYILYQAPAGSTKNGDLVIGTGGNGTTNRIIFSANGFDDPANNTQMTIDPGVRIHIEVPTQSTSTTTGALTVAGGMGVVGNMNVGGNVTITGSISLLGAGNTVSTDTLAVANSLLFLANGNASDTLDIGVIGQYQQGAPKYFGLVRDQSDGVFKLFLDASTRPANTVNFGQAGLNYGSVQIGELYTSNTTATSSSTTGSLRVAGGAGIAGGVWAGGAIRTDSTTPSTSVSTGALIVNGGAGIAGNVIAGAIQSTPIGSVTPSSGAFTTLAASGAVTVTSGTAASSHTTGAAVVTGGLGVSGAIFGNSTLRANGAVTFASTLDVTSTATFSGDVSVGGSLIANEIVEGVTDVAVSTNTYNVDYNNGNIFYATTAPTSGDFTLALTNVPTTNGRVTSVTLILPQGATARRPSGNAISINGTSTLVNFVGGNSSYTPTASKTDIFTFTILRRSSAFTVAGSVSANTVL
jgi:hypothetical protein